MRALVTLVLAAVVATHAGAQVGKIIGGNMLRVMKKVEVTSARLTRSRPASAARIEDLDRVVVP